MDFLSKSNHFQLSHSHVTQTQVKYAFMSPSTAESFEIRLGVLSSSSDYKQIACPFGTAYLLDFAKQKAKDLLVNASFTIWG